MPRRGFPWPRRSSPPATLSPALEAELRSPIGWMYPWQLTPEVTAPVPGSQLPRVHATRREMIEPVARAAIAAAGPGAAVLDIGCNEGWFAHRALEWGAARAVGFDVRELNIRRALLVRDHFGLAPEQLHFATASVYDLDAEELGTFDVVFVLGLIYHLENPIGALRVARSLTRGTVVVESQLTAHTAPIKLGWGVAGVFNEAPGHWASVVEPAEEQQAEGNLLSSYGGVVSLVPNAAALLEALEVVGFRDGRLLDAPPHADAQYVEGHRAIATATV